MPYNDTDYPCDRPRPRMKRAPPQLPGLDAGARAIKNREIRGPHLYVIDPHPSLLADPSLREQRKNSSTLITLFNTAHRFKIDSEQ